jgi:ubiquinone/menaquinone biosynthesis C-methylase UbiE
MHYPTQEEEAMSSSLKTSIKNFIGNIRNIFTNLTEEQVQKISDEKHDISSVNLLTNCLSIKRIQMTQRAQLDDQTMLAGSTLKSAVHEYWNQESCGTFIADAEKYTRQFYEEVETHRYAVEPEIMEFAQFPRHHGQTMLEVGVGAGTDFLQWVRAGVKAHGIDLTEEGIAHVQHRLGVYGLQAEEFKVADCENIPYADNTFDLVYSWGVIHHTADTPRALTEIVRVLKPGGTGKIMIYHRHSLVAYRLWVHHALLAGKPWKSLHWAVWNFMESVGTKSYTRAEARAMVERNPISNLRIRTIVTHYDTLGFHSSKVLQWLAKAFALCLGWNRAGWFMTLEFTKRTE